MILDVSRGNIKAQIENKIITIQGEMFFPGGDKMGFVLYTNTMTSWDKPNHDEMLTSEDKDKIISDIRADFSKGGHILEIEV